MSLDLRSRSSVRLRLSASAAGFHGPVAGVGLTLQSQLGIWHPRHRCSSANQGELITIMARLGGVLRRQSRGTRGVSHREASRPPRFPGRPSEYLKIR